MVTTRSKQSTDSDAAHAKNPTNSAPIGIAVVGSSGGGAATLGHTDPVRLLEQIQMELGRCRRATAAAAVQQHVRSKNSKCDDDDDVGDQASCEAPIPTIHHALYVSLHSGKGLDHATDSDVATLYAVGCEDPSTSASSTGKLQVRSVTTGPLSKVNEIARHLDQTYISASILNGTVQGGLICISADPQSVNTSSISAASQINVPITGSGGTSLSYMSTELGVELVGNAGGSVATTTYTRAVSYVYALVDAWGSSTRRGQGGKGWQWTYSPFAPSRYENGEQNAEEARPSLRSVLDSCVPAFVAVCVTCRLLELSLLWLKEHDDQVAATAHPTSNHYDMSLFEIETILSRLYWQLQYHALPTVCAVVAAATYVPELGSIVLMASAVASIACGGSALAGLLAGRAVAYLSKRALFGCIQMNVPATMTNVLVAGGVGCLVALLFGGSGLVHLLAAFGDALRSVVRMSFLIPAGDVTTQLPGLGFVAGVIFCYGSKVGWYHSIFLPLLLIEMERGEASILGAIDECTLCLVSAGICAGNVVTSMMLADGDVAISKRGVKINLLCGDFIEAAYPFMERSPVIVNGFAYLACGISTEILFYNRPEEVLSSAYLPFGLSIVLSEDMERMALACGAAFATSFVGAVLGNIVRGRTSEVEVEHRGRMKKNK